MRIFQQANAEGDPLLIGRDELRAAQIGASYRLSTKVRFYAAYYLYRFLNEGGSTDQDRYAGRIFLIGTRVTL